MRLTHKSSYFRSHSAWTLELPGGGCSFVEFMGARSYMHRCIRGVVGRADSSPRRNFSLRSQASLGRGRVGEMGTSPKADGLFPGGRPIFLTPRPSGSEEAAAFSFRPRGFFRPPARKRAFSGPHFSPSGYFNFIDEAAAVCVRKKRTYSAFGCFKRERRSRHISRIQAS